MAVITCSYYSVARMGQRCFTAVLPVDRMPEGFGPVTYQDGPWPTLYLLHGFSGNHNDWLYGSRVQEWATRHGWAVIMPDGGNSFWLDSWAIDEQAGMQTGVELVEVTRRLFPLSHRREDTAIGGLSMGGYGALRNGLKYHETFGHIAAMSSALIMDEVAAMTPGKGNPVASYEYYRSTFAPPEELIGSDRDPRALAEALAGKEEKPRILLACGYDDPLYALNVEMHEHLERLGYEHRWFTAPGNHDFDFWNLVLQDLFPWLKG